MRRILCFGDSNTYGYSPVDGQRFGDDINWPGVLNQLLGDKFEVINEGKNGRTIAFDDPYNEGCNGMNDIQDCIERNKPVELVVIMLGTNDLKVYFDAMPQDIADNLLDMCKLVQENTDAKLIIASPMLLGDQIEFSPLHLEFGRTQVDYSFELAPAFQRVAQAVDAEFIDLAMVAMSSDVDCLHLMPEEHAKIAQAMKEKVLLVFKEELEQEAKEEEEAKAAELRRIQEEEAQKQKEEEERQRAEEEAKRQAEEEERRRIAEEEAKLREEEEERQRAEEEARLKEEEEAAQQRVEEEARLKVEAILKAAEEEVAREEKSIAESQPEPSVSSLADKGSTEFVDLPLVDGNKATGSMDEVQKQTAVSSEIVSEKEKMTAGKLYRCDKALREDMAQARKVTGVYNQTSAEEVEKRTELLGKLFHAVGSNPYIEAPFRCDYGYNISVGDNFYANFDCIMLDVGKIKIGDNVFFGPKVNIYTACHPIYAPIRNEQLEYSKEVTIGDDVWIGGNVTINPGVHIGDNVVIGSGSVVTKDIPDGVVAAGNPCRIVRRISDADKQYWEEKKAEYDA